MRTCKLLLFICLLAPARGRSAELILVEAGKPVATVYLPCEPALEPLDARARRALSADEAARRDAEATLADAAEELVYHIEKMSGARLEVVGPAGAADIGGPAIVLDALARELGVAPEGDGPLAEQGFRIALEDGRLLIGGGSAEGTRNGVYALLEHLGCDWVMPGAIGEIVPRRATVRVADLDLAEQPSFRTRLIWYRGYPKPRLPEEKARFERWIKRQKGGGSRHPAMGTGGHVWQAFIRRHQEEFDADPTMLALRRGADGTLQRMGPQLETTHPRVIELFVEDIKAAFEANGWPKDHVAAFGIGPADGLGYSVSPESTLAGSGRVDPIVGEPDRTDLLVLLANQIFEKLGDEYPNVYLGCYSYSTHADFPMRYQPHPRFVQIFAPINFSRFHGIMDGNSKTQAYYRDVLNRWRELGRAQGNVLFYRGYTWNLAENLVPYSKIRIWGEELPFYHDMGVAGLNVEGTKMWSITGPSDYVFMQLAWDASRDWRDVLRRYCVNAFGKGAAPMERYLLRLTGTQHAAGQEAGSYHALHLVFDDAFVAAAREDLAEASKLADTAEDRTRIDYVGYGIDALALYLAYHAATMAFDFEAAMAAYNEMTAHWEKTYAVNTDLVANEAPQYLRRFLQRFVEEARNYSSGDYRIVERLPDAMKTMFDPNAVGHRMRYQSPAINDGQFVTTRTYSTTWDAQGLTGLRTGAVWYRFHFSLPQDLAGKPIGLFVGGVEDEARVWINGETIGTSGRRFSVPCLFDLTDGIDYEGENVLAIQVVRNSAANEIGLGGIIRPSFIFTGPRLAEKAPKPLELRRVLPGGELGELEE